MDRELVNLKNELENIFANQKFLNEICSVVTDGFSINYKGKIIYCNEKYAEIFGYKKEELVGKDVLNLCSEKEKEFWKKILEEDKEGEFMYVKPEYKVVVFPLPVGPVTIIIP